MNSVSNRQHYLRRHSQAQQQLTLQQREYGEREYEEDVSHLKKGPWTAEEDALLLAYVNQHGENNWNSVQKYAGVARCGKSCRLRWTNHLRPDLKKGQFSANEERIVIEQHAALGNRWSRIANMVPGRTDNDVKNFWNTRMKRLLRGGQPLYPADVVPVVYGSSPQSEVEKTASQRAVAMSLNKDFLVDSSSREGPCKSDFTIEHDQSNLIGEARPGKASLSFNGARPRSSRAVDASVFSLVNANILVSPGSFENAIQGVKRAREEPFNELMGNTSGGSFYRFSSNGLCAQSDFKARRLHGSNPVRSDFLYQGFPYDPDGKSRTFGISKGGGSFGCDNRSKQSATPTHHNFSIPRCEMAFECLNIELPSVQLAESADSSSSLSSPFSMGQTLPLSEVDSFGSASHECVYKKNGKLLDVLLQQNSSSPNQVPADFMEQLLVVTSSNTSPKFAGSSTVQNVAWMASNDPLSLLGGRSLTLFNGDIKVASENSLPNTFESPLSSLKTPSGRDSPQLKSSEQVSPLVDPMVENQSLGPHPDDELYMLLAFEKPEGLPVADFYAEGAHAGTSNGCQEEGGHLGGLDAIFGQTAGVDLEQLVAMSGISNAWELSSCAWNSMPGAL